MTGALLRTTTARNTHFQDIAKVPDDTGPPWQLRNQTMIYVGGHWPADARLPDLPTGLTPGPDRSGVLGIYVAPEGRGLAPLNLAFGALAVQETWAPDGTQAAFIFHAFTEGPFADRIARWLNNCYLPGQAGVETGEEWRAFGRCEEGEIRLCVRRLPGERQLGTDTNYCIGLLDGMPSGYAVAYSVPFHLGEVTEFAVDLPHDHPMAVFRSFAVDYVMLIEDMSMTYGRAVPLDLATQDRGSTLGDRQASGGQVAATLDVFGRLGRAIALSDDAGRVLYANSAAEAVLKRLPSGVRLPAQETAAEGGRGRAGGELGPEGLRLTLALADGGTAFARVMPVGLRLNERPTLMILFDDPAELGPFDPGVLLRLYGLTPSEARLAVLVGQGLSPAGAAKALGITGETARTGLKVVFGKLGINRQAKLARIVARLEML